MGNPKSTLIISLNACLYLCLNPKFSKKKLLLCTETRQCSGMEKKKEKSIQITAIAGSRSRCSKSSRAWSFAKTWRWTTRKQRRGRAWTREQGTWKNLPLQSGSAGFVQRSVGTSVAVIASAPMSPRKERRGPGGRKEMGGSGRNILERRNARRGSFSTTRPGEAS